MDHLIFIFNYQICDQSSHTFAFSSFSQICISIFFRRPQSSFSIVQGAVENDCLLFFAASSKSKCTSWTLPLSPFAQSCTWEKEGYNLDGKLIDPKYVQLMLYLSLPPAQVEQRTNHMNPGTHLVIFTDGDNDSYFSRIVEICKFLTQKTACHWELSE